MKKVELLAPAGSMEALYAAVQNGCDAVYLGGEMFGARAFAHNFSKEDIVEAVRYAHIYGVKVYVTVNTLIKEEELEDVITYVSYLQSVDVDALIVQDLGLLSILRTQFPDMEVHASTQMHVHNPQGIQFLKDQGVKRVVVPRETSIEEIREYVKLGVDLEVFVQGALCVSYSGQCLMSSVLFDRSGNRGACAQPCRMQYGLYKEDQGKWSQVPSKGDYLLSPKDLNVLDQLPSLMDAGVASFKIEGRMKRPEYVACMVSLYRKAIDAHAKHKKFKVSAQMLEEMEKLFHRGFTNGHIYHAMGSALMNPIRPNHMGVEIGRIQKLSKDRMSMRLTKELHQGDGIRILSDQEDEGFRVNKIYKYGLLVNHGNPGDVIELDRIKGIQEQAIVLKTSDSVQLKRLQKSYQGYQRKVLLWASFTMIKGIAPMLCVYDENGYYVEVIGEVIVEKALKTPLTKDRLAQQLHKSNDTPFTFHNIEFMIEKDATMPIKEVNRMRRTALEKLVKKREQRHEKRAILSPKYEKSNHQKQKGLSVVVHSRDQYLACLPFPVTIYIDSKALYEQLKQENPNVRYRSPRVMKQEYPSDALIQDIGGLYQNMPYVYDTSLNITNSAAAHFLLEHQASCVLFSLEMEKEDCIQMARAYQKHYGEGSFGYVVYGRRELMISEYCPINAIEKDSDKKDCGLCRQHDYMLIDQKKRRFPLLMDENCRMHLLEEEARKRFADIPDLKQSGIEQYVCIFTKETKEECDSILKEWMNECASN